MIILVINNSQNTSSDIVKKNHDTHKLIKNNFYNFEHIVLDCYSKGNEIKIKDFGVGTARKIGFDFALQYSKKTSLFICLDADTIVSKRYLKTIVEYYNETLFSACIVDFKHQKSNNVKLNKGIRIYEKALHEMAKKIKMCNSPYGYVSMGSTIICTSKAYVLIGGMPKKKAGEDFYFMQSLAKYAKIDFIDKILVYPSSRAEQRVHLGTGYRMNEYKEFNKFDNLFFPDSSYETIKNIILIAESNFCNSYLKLKKELIKNLSDKVCNFLNENDIENIWKNISLNSKTKKQFMIFFHQWFDAFKIIKLLKYIS